MGGTLLILHLLAFPFINLHSTLHCNALNSPSDRIVYLNLVKKGINMFSKKGVLRGGHNVTKGEYKIIFLRADAHILCPLYTNALVRPRV